MASLAAACEVSMSNLTVAGAGVEDEEIESLMSDTQLHQPQWEAEPAEVGQGYMWVRVLLSDKDPACWCS